MNRRRAQNSKMTNLAKLGVAIAVCKNDMHRPGPAAAFGPAGAENLCHQVILMNNAAAALKLASRS